MCIRDSNLIHAFALFGGLLHKVLIINLGKTVQHFFHNIGRSAARLDLVGIWEQVALKGPDVYKRQG